MADNNSLLEKVLGLQDKYAALQAQLSDPEVMADMKKFVQLNKDYKELEPIIKAGHEYKKMVEDLAAAKDIMANEKDEDLREMAREEIAEIEPKLPEMEQNIKLLLIPADPDDGKNAMVEIRGGTGGDEAAIFAGDLFRMYSKYAESKGWKLEITDQAPGTSGGYKQIVFKLSSNNDGVTTEHMFEYGRGNGLYEIEQNADSDQKVITRLRAYGSEKNLPSHYYADLGVKYVANITKVVEASTHVELELDLDYIETYFRNKRKYVVSGESQEQYSGWVLQVTFDFQTIITGYVTKAYDSKKCRFYSELKGFPCFQ